jgi:hypothetical protein
MRGLLPVLVVLASAFASAQAPGFQRDDVVVAYRQNDSAGPKIRSIALRVVGVPTDRLRVDNAGLYVNDIPVGGFSRDFLSRVARRPELVPQVVPEGHYFVMGEQRINQDIAEYWGQHSVKSLETSR